MLLRENIISKRNKMDKEVIKRIFYDTGDAAYFRETFNVSMRTVKNIKEASTYKTITSKLEKAGQIIKYKLSPVDVEIIYSSDKTLDELAHIYNIHKETVRNIKTGRTRKFDAWY